jgi:hypothetical protein
MSLGEWFVTFDYVALMFKNEAWSFEISETTHPMTHCHNPQDLNLQPSTCYRCKKCRNASCIALCFMMCKMHNGVRRQN